MPSSSSNTARTDGLSASGIFAPVRAVDHLLQVNLRSDINISIPVSSSGVRPVVDRASVKGLSRILADGDG